jgi:hypothetical protein
MKKLNVLVLGASAALASGSSFAAMDTTAAVGSVTDGTTAVGAIGAAFLAFVVLKKVWARIG